MIISRAVRQGPRAYQEDRHRCFRLSTSGFQGAMLAVMDGHKGSEVSELCWNRLESAAFCSNLEEGEAALSEIVRRLSEETERQIAGSTLSLALVDYARTQVSIAILGDSPVIVFDGDKLFFSPEHNVRSNHAERAEAVKRGGIYDDGYICNTSYDGLQLSRALGNNDLGKIISRVPEIYTIRNPKWILVASDGLFDPSHQATERLLQEMEVFAKEGATAGELMKWAEERGLEDNATAVVWLRN